jgi:hypothetical protein
MPERCPYCGLGQDNNQDVSEEHILACDAGFGG